MNYILLISLFAIIGLLFFNTSKEHFENNQPDPGLSIEDTLGELDINIDNYIKKDGEIDFDNLPLDKLDDSQINSILNSINKQFTQIDYSVQGIQQNNNNNDNVFNIFKLNIPDNERFKKNIVQKSNKPLEEKTNTIKLDIFKAKLLRDEILKRKLLRNNKLKLEMLKNKYKNLEEYSKNEIPSIINKCYMNEHPYNIGGNFDKYNLEITRHPVKWYGLNTNITNSFPSDFVYV